jgi:hypothetical protein
LRVSISVPEKKGDDVRVASQLYFFLELSVHPRSIAAEAVTFFAFCLFLKALKMASPYCLDTKSNQKNQVSRNASLRTRPLTHKSENAAGWNLFAG